MGKIYQTQQQLQEQIQDNQPQNSSCGCCSNGWIRIKNICSFKCIFILILSIALFLSAIFWIPPFNRLTSRFDANGADTLNVMVKASFRLKMSVALVVPRTETLEDDIFGEIGLPNTKVSILSMQQDTTSNWTDVVFGVLPDPDDVPINLVSLSVLKSSMVELFLGRLNMSLTNSIFGNASSFEILKFTGGINVVPVANAFVSNMPQTLFNFTLNNSISQIEASFQQFKDQLKYGLDLRPYENIYVQLKNFDGSTVDSPVTVQASVLSDGTHFLLPQRLKQLAQIIKKSPPAKNLGLDHSVFGKVKGISLSSILNGTLPSSPSPSPSPAPYSSSPVPSSPPDEHHNSAPSLSPEHTPTYAPAPSPSGDHHDLAPCYHCGASFPHAPIPAFGPQPFSPPLPESPAPSIPSLTPRPTPCHGYALPPSPVPAVQFNPSSSPPSLPPQPNIPSPLAPSSESTPYIPPSPSMSHRNQGWRKAKAPVLPPPASSPSPSLSPSPSPTSSVSDPRYREMSFFGMLLYCILHLLCQPYR